MKKLGFFVLTGIMLVCSAVVSAASDTAVLRLVGVVLPKITLDIASQPVGRALADESAMQYLIRETSNSALPYQVSLVKLYHEADWVDWKSVAADTGIESWGFYLNGSFVLFDGPAAALRWEGQSSGINERSLTLAGCGSLESGASDFIMVTVTAM